MPHGTETSCDRLWYLFTWVCCKQIMQKKLKVLYIVSLKLSNQKTHPEIVSPFHILLKTDWILYDPLLLRHDLPLKNENPSLYMYENACYCDVETIGVQ